MEKELHKIAKAEDKAQCLHTAGFELSKAAENAEENGDGPEVSDTHKPEDVIPSQTEGNSGEPKSLEEVVQNIKYTIIRAFYTNKSGDIEAVKKTSGRWNW